YRDEDIRHQHQLVLPAVRPSAYLFRSIGKHVDDFRNAWKSKATGLIPKVLELVGQPPVDQLSGWLDHRHSRIDAGLFVKVVVGITLLPPRSQRHSRHAIKMCLAAGLRFATTPDSILALVDLLFRQLKQRIDVALESAIYNIRKQADRVTR